LLVAGCSYLPSTVPTPTAVPSVSPAVSQGNNSPAAAASLKFSDQTYYSYSYLISGDNLSADAQTALTGFTLNKQVLADGNTQIKLTATNPEYKDQQYILKPGEQLYFIEKFLGDDQGGKEGNILDDMAVVVDAQDNVVQAPVSW
jgi:hypothetical protein